MQRTEGILHPDELTKPMDEPRSSGAPTCARQPGVLAGGQGEGAGAHRRRQHAIIKQPLSLEIRALHQAGGRGAEGAGALMHA